MWSIAHGLGRPAHLLPRAWEAKQDRRSETGAATAARIWFPITAYSVANTQEVGAMTAFDDQRG
jgi:hypothetical protein